MIIFPGTQLASLTDGKPVRLVIEGFKDPDERLFLNELSGEVQPNFQLLYAIGQGKYLDAFAQRLAPYVISGTHILAACNGQPVTQQAQPAFLTFYQENNIVARAAKNKGPLLITFNSIVLKSYLIKLVIGSYQKEGVDGHQFQLHILSDMPDPTANDELSGEEKFAQDLAAKEKAFDESFQSATGGQSSDSEYGAWFSAGHNSPPIGYETPPGSAPGTMVPVPTGPGAVYHLQRIT